MEEINDADHSEQAPSPCGSTSSGEIKDDGEVDKSCDHDVIPGASEDKSVKFTSNSDLFLNEVSTSNNVAYYRRTTTRSCVAENSDERRRFDPKQDYRPPYLTADEINSRIMKIPSPAVLFTNSDVGIRCLVADMHALDREQIRLLNNRMRLLEEMRTMYNREMKSLRECFESVSMLHIEKGLNIMDSRVGKDVMEFFLDKGIADKVTRSSALGPSEMSPVPGDSSHSLFPPTQSLAQKKVLCPPYVGPALSCAPIVGPFLVPPPDMSVPPPNIPISSLKDGVGPPKNMLSDLNSIARLSSSPSTSVVSGNLLTSIISPAGAGSGVNHDTVAKLPSQFIPPVVNGTEAPSTNCYQKQLCSNVRTFLPQFGRFPEKASCFDLKPYLGPVFDMPLPIVFPSPMSVLDEASALSREDLPYMNGRCPVPFHLDELPPFPYDCGALNPGADPIRIRHIYDIRKAQPRRQFAQQDGAQRKRDLQRPGWGTVKERRDRSPLMRAKSVESNNGAENGVVSNAGPEETTVVLDENSEPVTRF